MSSSYKSDLNTLRKIIGPLLDDLEEEFPGSKYSMATFIDKGYYPFGSSGNYCYRLETGMTTDRSILVTKVNNLQATGGSDVPESQLDGLYHGLRSSHVGWSTGTHDSMGNPILRVVIMATDAVYHKAGEAVAKDSRKFQAHPGDREANCLKYDYPTENMIVEAFDERQATPLFLVNGSSQRNAYEQLRQKIGRGGGVEPLASDSSNVVDLIKKGVTEITCQTTTTKPTTTTQPPPSDEGEGVSTAVVVGAASAGALGLAAVGMGGYAYANSATSAVEAVEFDLSGDAINDTNVPDRENMVGIEADAFA